MHITCKYARRDSAAAHYTHCVQLSTARVVNTKQCADRVKKKKICHSVGSDSA